jgi:hypothetical protein
MPVATPRPAHGDSHLNHTRRRLSLPHCIAGPTAVNERSLSRGSLAAVQCSKQSQDGLVQ